MRVLRTSALLLPFSPGELDVAGTRVITPNREAARSLEVPARTLRDVACRLLEQNGIHVASTLVARRALARAVAEAGDVSDVPGFAEAAEPTLRELMRAGVDCAQLSEDESSRVRRLAAVVVAYRRELAGIEQAAGQRIDDADVMWRAADLCRSADGHRSRIVVVGYPRLPVSERAFIDAYAAPGSVVYLPASDVPLFRETHEAIGDFEARGWRVEKRAAQARDIGERLALAWIGGGLESEASDPEAPDPEVPDPEVPDPEVPSPEALDQAEADRAIESAAPNPSVPDAAAADGVTGHAAPVGAAISGVATLGAATEGAGLTARAYPDLDTEVRGTLAEVKRLLLAGVSADRIAVVARHEQAYGPLLLSVAEEYRVPFRVLYSLPVADTRFGAWVAACLEIIPGDYPFEKTARWLADPVVAALDAATWTRARRTHPAGETAWRELGVRIPTLSWPDAAPRGDYVGQLSAFLLDFDIARRCAGWTREALAVRVFADGLKMLTEPEQEISFAAFAAEIDELLAVLSVRVSPGRGGVELHTPLSLFGAKVDHVFIVGAAEGQLPNPVRPDPLLDPLERARLTEAHPGIEDVRAAARREELSFWTLLQSPKAHVALSYPKLIGRSEILPSPYFERLGVEPQPARPAAICSGRELRRVELPAGTCELPASTLAGDPAGAPARTSASDTRAGADARAGAGAWVGANASSEDPILAHARHARTVELERESERPHGAHDGVTGIGFAAPERGIGVSRLIDMASCPFKFWAKSILRLEEPEEAPKELDFALRGTLYHEALHRTVQHAMGSDDLHSGNSRSDDPRSDDPCSDDLREAALEHLEAAFEEAEAALEETHGVSLAAFPTWERDRDEHITVLRNAIRGDDFTRPGAQVVALEKSFRGSWRGIRVRGRIDRVDAGPNGMTLIDYKSGSSVSGMVKDGGGKAAIDLQLPVYREGAMGLLHELADRLSPELASRTPLEIRDSYYFSVTKAKKIAVSAAPDEELERIARDVADAWRDGSFPVDPDVDQHACTYCDFDPVCRKGSRLDRKRSRE